MLWDTRSRRTDTSGMGHGWEEMALGVMFALTCVRNMSHVRYLVGLGMGGRAVCFGIQKLGDQRSTSAR